MRRIECSSRQGLAIRGWSLRWMPLLIGLLLMPLFGAGCRDQEHIEPGPWMTRQLASATRSTPVDSGTSPASGFAASSGSAVDVQSAATTPSDVLGSVQGEALHVREVRSLLRGRRVLGEDRRAALLARRRQALDGAIVRRLAALEARRRGLAEDLHLRAELESQHRELWADEESRLRDALFDEIRAELTFSETELRRHYEQTRSRYLERQVRLQRQDFPTRAAAEAALGRGRQLDPAISETIGPAPLRDLPGRIGPEILELASEGDRVVIERDGAAALIELVELLPAEPLPFERVRSRVEKSVRTLRGQASMRALLRELRAEARIAIDEAALVDDSLWEPIEERMSSS